MSLVSFLSGLYNNRHEDGPFASCCDDFSEIYIMLSIFSFQGFGERAILVLKESKSAQWEKKMETLVWRVVDTFWRKLEELKI